ncbi:RNA-binding protein Pasilla [Parasteatoda tepidariorum]|uniref:RNA-binding protein Pasilla n=1 Tax=Parasteatoda tepidariorum TaxID=114398 RepID=UPI00077F9997|nr:RNA-binding protein Nova-1 [Parasteatoda tepidariorum]XP_042901938.1 RNA-binding protein Nova-1 [Parasteatoda tepidariorum]XP_042901939.1 RNA-binding protein Nova-1 [Parasteatoda tepidariorum]XP_042901940.1 RNA-binding protein Nova-1 [Parasteatoda tepidariorum]
MATPLGGVDDGSESDFEDSRKRPLDPELDDALIKRSHHGGGNGTYHFKILVPSVAAGAIIGKGGETIAQLQKEVCARVKMSKATDFYPGTRERVCLITGSVEAILHIHDFIMEKIKEKPDPNAKLAIDFDHKQPAEREKQVKILVPNSTVGMIMGKGGSYIKQIKEKSGAYVQISQKSKDHALVERCITVIGEIENNKIACSMILAKIVQDPQSGNCLNVSYADVTGPIANFNPTGSPFANPRPSGAANTSNTSYSSNDSLNSIGPSMVNLQNSQNNTAQQAAGMVPVSGMGMPGPSIPTTNHAQAIEMAKVMLSRSGYSDQAIHEITAAFNTLASYGLLGSGALNMCNGMNGVPVLSGMGMSNPNPTMPSAGVTSQGIYSSMAGVPGMEGAASSSDPMGTGSSMFGTIRSLGNGVSGLGFTSPTTSHSSDRFLVQAEGAVFESFQRTSPTLASPSAAALPVNNNSFGLGTSLNAGPSSLQISPTPNDRQVGGDMTEIEIEVGENIVGAILGPGGKALVDIQRYSGANIQISKKGIFVPGTRNRKVTIYGNSSSVTNAQILIQKQIADEEAKRAQQKAMGILH